MSEVTNSEQPAQELRVEQTEFPRDPVARKGVLLSALNFGPKVATEMLLPPPGSYISPTDLTAAFRTAFAGTEIASFSDTTAPGYCRESLVKLGLVAGRYSINHFGQEKIVGYGQTEASQNYGLKAGCLVLRTERDINQSLITIFGSSNTTSSEQVRAPLVRAQVLEFLYEQSSPVTGAEIARALKIDHGVALDAVRTLLSANVVSKRVISPKSSEDETTLTTYSIGTLSAEEMKSTANWKNLRGRKGEITQICMDLAQASSVISVDSVLDKLTTENKSEAYITNLRNYLTGVLADLARLNFLVIANDFQRVGPHSEILVNEKGRKIVDDLLRPLDLLVKDDSQFDEIYGATVRNVTDHFQDYARNSGNLYFPHSKAAKRRETETSIGKLRQFLSDPNDSRGRSVKQLSSLLNVHENTVRAYIQRLKGNLGQQTYRGTTYFKLHPQELR